jgi:hypothetical protein
MPLPAGARTSGSLRGGGEARPSLCLGGELPSLEGDDGRLNGEPGGALKASRMGTPTFITAPPLTMKSSRKSTVAGSETAFDPKAKPKGLRNFVDLAPTTTLFSQPLGTGARSCPRPGQRTLP